MSGAEAAGSDEARMDLAVMGMMRSGTTLVADLLTVPGRSLVLNEPYLLDRWSPELQEKLDTLYRGFGLELPRPETRVRYPLNQGHFLAEILPQLRRLGCQWGAKYADLHSWRRTFAAYRPRKLIITARDLRDVFLSGLELLNRARLLFSDGRHLRDEAWLFAFIAATVHELMALRREPHLVIRYEDLVTDPATPARLAEHAGLDRLGTGRLNLDRHGPDRAGWERAKHGDAITRNSLGRFEQEPSGPMRAHAERLWRMFPEYAEAFGYEPPEHTVALPPNGLRGTPGIGHNPVDYQKLADWRWRGPEGFEPLFGARRARAIAGRAVRRPVAALELGAGSAAFGRMLPAGSTLLAVDCVARGPRFQVADLARGLLPPAGGARVVNIFGLLEFVEDLPGFFANLRRYARPAIASYYAAEDTSDLDRSALGWRNHLTRDALDRMLRGAGFAVAADWAIDGRLSMLRLRPSQEASSRKAARE